MPRYCPSTLSDAACASWRPDLPRSVTHVRSILLALLGALLLVSQHTAVTHALWHQAHDTVHHATTPAQAGESHDHDDGPGTLCAFDAMLGQMLDGASIAATHDLPPVPAAMHASLDVRHLLATHVVQPRSRGPPIAL